MNHRYGIDPPDDGPRDDDTQEGCAECGEPTLLRGIEVRGRLRFLCADHAREAVRREAYEAHEAARVVQLGLRP